MYSATFSGSAFTAAVDAFELVAPADAIVVIHELELSQGTELGDAAEEQLLILLRRGFTASGSGGTAFTPLPINFGDAAFGGTCEFMNTTQANTGTVTNHFAGYWNIRVPFQKIWTPETRIILSPSQRLVVTLPAPTDSVTLGGTLTFEEIGG
jgi:hypothetical protein